MDSFAFDKYMSLCFSWFGASTADYVVVFTPIIALDMIDAFILLSLFIYVFLMPGFHFVLLIRYCVLVFPSAFVFIESANFVIMSIFVMVSVLFCSPISSVVQ